MEPEEGTSDYNLWEDAIAKVTGKAEIILSLSRESEFPRRKDVVWNGSTTSYGPPFKQAMNEGRRLI
jgi:replicative DNA helicase